jgi:hypothetical protein
MTATAPFTRIAVLGDLHGHLQLGLCTLARWQAETGIPISAILLAGDIGTFTDECQLDSATRAHARNNPCELEFLTQWSMTPPPPWLDAIFQPHPEGLGLACPVIMVHGNHEGFAHLATLANPRRPPTGAATIDSLPTVDTLQRIHYLPSGWRVTLPSGHTVAGIGGMEAGQRRAKYHSLAYIDDQAVSRLLNTAPVDILLTHQGPAAVQGSHGSATLDLLLQEHFARFWFHGHSTPILAPTHVGDTLVVPLGDVTFASRGQSAGDAGRDGWCLLDLHPDGTRTLHRDPPTFWRDLRRQRWHQTPGGRLVHPDLARFT